jgi:hypothetical protein
MAFKHKPGSDSALCALFTCCKEPAGTDMFLIALAAQELASWNDADRETKA